MGTNNHKTDVTDNVDYHQVSPTCRKWELRVLVVSPTSGGQVLYRAHQVPNDLDKGYSLDVTVPWEGSLRKSRG